MKKRVNDQISIGTDKKPTVKKPITNSIQNGVKKIANIHRQ